jgi:predicted secreted protein
MLKFLILFLSFSAFSSQKEFIDALGASPKGQYIALEEYGYSSEKRQFYSSIKIMNVWKKEYVGKAFQVEQPAINSRTIDVVRKKARTLAQDELKKFQISG